MLLLRLMQARSFCWECFLGANIWSQHFCASDFSTFHYRKGGSLARASIAFVGGTPLICTPWHCDDFSWVWSSWCVTRVTERCLRCTFHLHCYDGASSRFSVYTCPSYCPRATWKSAWNCFGTYFIAIRNMSLLIIIWLQVQGPIHELGKPWCRRFC